jgi:hypothetical protein
MPRAEAGPSSNNGAACASDRGVTDEERIVHP